jgi:hypothetical protein
MKITEPKEKSGERQRKKGGKRIDKHTVGEKGIERERER